MIGNNSTTLAEARDRLAVLHLTADTGLETAESLDIVLFRILIGVAMLLVLACFHVSSVQK